MTSFTCGLNGSSWRAIWVGPTKRMKALCVHCSRGQVTFQKSNDVLLRRVHVLPRSNGRRGVCNAICCGFGSLGKLDGLVPPFFTSLPKAWHALASGRASASAAFGARLSMRTVRGWNGEKVVKNRRTWKAVQKLHVSQHNLIAPTGCISLKAIPGTITCTAGCQGLARNCVGEITPEGQEKREQAQVSSVRQ